MHARPVRTKPSKRRARRLRRYRPARTPAPTSKTAAAEPTGKFERADAPPVRFELPEGWTLEKPSKPMRMAEFVMPGGLRGVVYYFGEGQGGGLEPNIQRWKGQWAHVDDWKRETLEVDDGITVTILSGSGILVAPATPGSGHPPQNKTDQALLAAFLEVPKGPMMLKVVGPEKDVQKVAGAFRSWIRSFKVAK